MNRRRSMLRRCALLAAFALLPACASKPVHLYTLVGADTASAMPAGKPYAVAIEPVSVPRQADIPQLIVPSSDGRAYLSEDHRWRAPLADEIGTALSQQLQVQFGVADLSRVSAAEGLKVIRVRVDVQRFESLPASDGIAGHQALLSAAWSLRDADAKLAAASCVTQVRENSGTSHDALVLAYRRAVSVLATQIGQGLERLAQNPSAFVCPAVTR